MIASIGHVLHERLLHDDSRIVSYLVDETGSEDAIAAGRLRARAWDFAQALPPVPPSAPAPIAAVCLYHGLDLHAAWIGCVWAGYVPSMVAPPSIRMDAAKYARGFRETMAHMQAQVQIISREAQSLLGEAAVNRPGVVVADAVPASAVSSDRAPVSREPDDVVLVQHSSGTTGLQKAIAMTSRQVLSHNHAYIDWLGIASTDTIASWLPLYHDMGFVAGFLLPLLHGIPLVEISPLDWVRRPLRLLDAIDAHRATLCWMPNFAFSFLATAAAAAPAADRDLSCVRAWINSSEPVMARSGERFVAAFAGQGVRRAQMTACYAMAENVYAVSQSRPGHWREVHARRQPLIDSHRVEVVPSASPETVTLVSNGAVLPTTELKITTIDGLAAPESVGEIHLRGAHRFAGYYGRPDLTAASIDPDGWYATGDLGFVRDGELYVTGRVKDLIIIQGRNFYPADIEDAVATLDGVAPGRVAAFGVTDEEGGTEQLVVVAEAVPGYSEAPGGLALRIRAHIAQSFNCTPHDVRVMVERWVVKSTSGKVARADNRAKYLTHVHQR